MIFSLLFLFNILGGVFPEYFEAHLHEWLLHFSQNCYRSSDEKLFAISQQLPEILTYYNSVSKEDRRKLPFKITKIWLLLIHYSTQNRNNNIKLIISCTYRTHRFIFISFFRIGTLEWQLLHNYANKFGLIPKIWDIIWKLTYAICKSNIENALLLVSSLVLSYIRSSCLMTAKLTAIKIIKTLAESASDHHKSVSLQAGKVDFQSSSIFKNSKKGF